MAETELDKEIVPEVIAAIDLVGTAATYLKVSDAAPYDPGNIDPDNLDFSGGASDSGGVTTTEYSIISTPEIDYRIERGVDNTGRVGTLYVLIYDYSTFTPSVNDKLIKNGVTYNIKEVIPYRSGELVAAWHIGLREGSESAN